MKYLSALKVCCKEFLLTLIWTTIYLAIVIPGSLETWVR